MFQSKNSRHGFGKKWLAVVCTLLCCGLLAGSCTSPIAEAEPIDPGAGKGDPTDPTKTIE